MNNNDINIRLIAKDMANQVIAGVRSDLKQFTNDVKESSNQSNLFTGIIAGAAAAVVNFGLNLAQAAVQNFVSFLNDSSKAAAEFERSMTTLSIVAPKFGVKIEDAQNAAKSLGEELRIGVGPAAESIQNLLKSGLNLDQARELLKRFTNEAITGKSSNLSLADAVKNLSFAYNTNNSMLGNLSGISENFNNIIEKGKEIMKQQGFATKDITDDMAKYYGMIALTNLTLDSSSKFTGTLIDTQAQLELRTQKLKIAIGQALNPILNELLKIVINVTEDIGTKLQPVLDALGPTFEKVKAFITQAIAEASKFADQVSAVVSVLFGVATGTGDAQGAFNNLIKVFGLSADEANKVSYILGDLSLVASEVKDFLSNAASGIQAAFQKLASFFDKNIKVAINGLRKAFDDLRPTFEKLQPHLENIANFILNILGGAVSLLGSILGWLIDNVLKPLIEFIASNLGPAFEFIGTVIAAIIEGVSNGISFFNDNILPVIQNFIAGINQFGAVTNSIFNGLVIPVIQLVAKVFETGFNWILAVVSSVWNGIMAVIQPVLDWLNTNVISVIKSVVAGISDAFTPVGTAITSIFDGVKAVIKDTLNWIIDRINDFLGSANNFIGSINSIAKSVGTSPITFKVDKIPRLAQGMNLVPNDNFLAVLHKNEAVVPANQNPYNPNASQPDRKMQGNISVNITINGYNKSPTELANEVVNKLAGIYNTTSLGLNKGY